MKKYIEDMLVRLKAILTEDDLTILPRRFTPGEKLALISVVEWRTEEDDPVIPIYAKDVEARINIHPSQWEEGRRPFDMHCLLTEVVDNNNEYIVKALLAPAIQKKYPNIDGHDGPRFVSHLTLQSLYWDYNEYHHFAWQDQPRNATLYPYPVDADKPLYIDLEYFFVLIIGLDGVFRTTLDSVIRFLVNYLDDNDEARQQWGEYLHDQFTELHYLTFLHQQSPTGSIH